jgi:hypothetical protein
LEGDDEIENEDGFDLLSPLSTQQTTKRQTLSNTRLSNIQSFEGERERER